MKRSRKFIKSLTTTVAPPLAAFLLSCVFKTLRWKRNDLKNREAIDGKAPVIAAFWHGRQLMLAPLYNQTPQIRKVSMLISGHSDGRLIAKVIRFFRIDTIVGSSSKGGAQALLQLVRAIELGESVGITPDGPRGPVYKAKEGAIKLAELTGAAIYPMAYGAQKKWTFKSWDKMILPKPFSKAVCIVGSPMRVFPMSSETDLSRYLGELEARLQQVTQEADNYF